MSSIRPKTDPELTPKLPFEIVRRIIHCRLALEPSFPCRLRDDEPVSPRWDALAGQCGRQASLRRRKERLEVQDASLDLMRVCKAWKPVVMRYLYSEPAIHSSNLLSLTAAIVNGDKKWSDLNIHPHSIPGRYVSTLDLSHLDDGYPSLHITTIDSALQALLPLLPNVTHLVLPARSPLRCDHIALAPFAKRLKCLQGLSVYSFPTPTGPGGVNVIRGRGGDPFVWLLRQLSNLEILSVHGPGNTTDLLSPPEPTTEETNIGIQLNRLHTLTLDGVKSGPLLRALTQSDLPSLRRLLLTSYHGLPGDETYQFQIAHGTQLISLTYMHSHEWPTTEAIPPEETLEIHPSLRHLSFAYPHSFLQTNLELAMGLTGGMYRHHPLCAITVPKWNENGTNQSPAPTPSVTPLTQTVLNSNGTGTPQNQAIPINTSRTPNRFLSTIVQSPPGNLRIITIDGFRWVRPDLGRTALEAGNSGTMRNWAVELATRGLEMKDMEGKVLPAGTGVGAGGGAGGLRGAGVGGEISRGRRGDRRVSGPGLGVSGGHWGGRSRDRGVEDGS